MKDNRYQNEQFYIELGERLWNRRKNIVHKTQEAFIGELVNNTSDSIGRNTLSDAENGRFSGLTLKQFLSMCDVLGCTAGHLLGEYNETSDDYHYICSKTGLSEPAVARLCSFKNTDVPFLTQFARFYSAFICDYGMLGVLSDGLNRYFDVKENGIPENSEFSNNKEALSFYKSQIENEIIRFMTSFFENEYKECNETKKV